MKLRYKVPEEIYIDMLEMQVKQKNRGFLSVLITLLCTVGQFGLFIYLTVSGMLKGEQVYIIGALSIAACVLNVIYRITTRRRAKVALERFKLTGKLHEDFWKEHVFEMDEEKLTIRYGSLKSVYALSELQGYDTIDKSFIIYARGTIADLVPFSAMEDKDQFIETIRNAQHTSIVDNAQDMRSDIPASYKYHFNYSYDLDTYVKHQREAYRKRYTTKLAYDRHSIIRFAISAYAVGYIFVNPKPVVIAVCIILFILLNTQHIVTFTPLCNRTIKSGIADVLAHKPDPNTDTYVTPDNIIIRGSMHSLDIPICDIKAMRVIDGGIALYMPKGVILTIPDVGGDFETFVKFMSYKAN